MSETGEALAVVRLRRGVVGESKRVCHLIHPPSESATQAYVVALCGEPIYPGQAEVLDRIAGMPCHLCLMRSSRPRTGALPAAG